MKKLSKWVSYLMLIVMLTAASNITYIQAAVEDKDYEDEEYSYEDSTDEEAEDAAAEAYNGYNYPYRDLEEPSSVQGFDYQLEDNVEFLPKDTEYELEPAPVEETNTTSSKSASSGKKQVADTEKKRYLPGTNIMKLPDDAFIPEEDKIYIDSDAQGSFKVIDEIVTKEDAVEVPVVQPSVDEVFDSFYIPRQTIALTKGNITDLEEGVELVEESGAIKSLSLLGGSENELPPADTSRNYHEFNIPSKTIYEYPEKEKKDDSELPKGKTPDPNQPSPTPTPVPNPEDIDARETGKESMGIKVKLKGGKVRIYEPTLIAEADWNGDFDLGFESLKVESNITIEGNITFSKEVCVRLYGYGVDFGSDAEIMGHKINGHIGIGIYAIFGINGEITITAKIEQVGEIKGGVTGNFWPVLLGVPSAIPYAFYESERFDVALMLDAKIHAWAYVGPQLTLNILDFNLLTIQVWVGVEGDALVTAEASTQGTGSMQMDLSLDFVVLFRAWVFNIPYEKYLLRANIYKNSFSFAYGETVSADSQKEKDITPVIKLDGVDAYWDTIWGSATYYDEFYNIQPIANAPVKISVTEKNGTVADYMVNTDSNGDFSLQITDNLTPSDLVMVSIDQEVKSGEYVTKYHGQLSKPVNPEVPFQFKLLETDGFNDIVTASISPASACPGHPEARNYSGPVKVYVVDEAGKVLNTKNVTVKNGVLEVSYNDAMLLSGGHKAYAELTHEGKTIISEKVEADLDSLKLNVGCNVNGISAETVIAAILNGTNLVPGLGVMVEDIQYAGTVTNLVKKKAYEGDIRIEINTSELLTFTDEVTMRYNMLKPYALTKPSIEVPEVGIDSSFLERMKTQVSTFEGDFGSEVCGDSGRFIKGITFTLEYENMMKVVNYNFMADSQTLENGTMNAVDSILQDRIDSRINPADVILTQGASQMTVRGKVRAIDGSSNTSVMMVGKNVFVPAQAVVEALGGSCSYNAKTGRATIKLNNKTVTVTRNKTLVTVGKSSKTLKAAPFIPGGVFMIPASLLSDCCGYQTTWDSDAKTLTIKLKTSKASK